MFISSRHSERYKIFTTVKPAAANHSGGKREKKNIQIEEKAVAGGIIFYRDQFRIAAVCRCI